MRQLFIVAIVGLLGVALLGSARAQAVPPAAPTDLVAEPEGASPNILFWHDNADNEDSFRIERSFTSENGPWELVADVASAEVCILATERQCSYIYDLFFPDTTYWYRVAAVNTAGTSAYSNVASVQTASLPTPAPGEIRGVVFHDKDGDGVRDAGEEGLGGMKVELFRGSELVRTRGTGDGYGDYGFGGLPAGDYTVVADLQRRSFPACSGGVLSFDPLQRRSAACSTPGLPWDPTTPATVTVTLNGGGAGVDFGARPADVEVLVGSTILETDYAPRGTVIVAFVNGQECGTTTVVGGSDLDFDIDILGAGERTGCARPGDLVQFTVGGVPAISTATWRPFSDPREPVPFGFGNIVAMQQHAWYWFQVAGSDTPANGTRVQAVIDGVVCGEARIEVPQPGGMAGFSKLIVPSAELQAGCGRPDAMVSFLFDSVAKGDPIEWRPGLQYINPLVGPVILPTTGSASTNGRKSGLLEAAIASLLGSALLIGTGRLAARRRS